MMTSKLRTPINILISAVAIISISAILRQSLFEIVTDIAVSPPENIRRTDFSWITVNEWFNSQLHILSSHIILKNIATDIDEDKLRKAIRAERLGAADIIRIHVVYDDKTDKLITLSENLVTEYLRYLTSGNVVAPQKVIEPEQTPSKKPQEVYEKEIADLKLRAGQITKEIAKLTSESRQYEEDFQKAHGESQFSSQESIKNKIAKISNDIYTLSNRIGQLKQTYTDNWPEIVKSRDKIEQLEHEKERLNFELIVSKKAEDQKLEMMVKLDSFKDQIDGYEDMLREVNRKIADTSALLYPEAKIEKNLQPQPKARTVTSSGYGYVINPPAVNALPDIGVRLSYALGASFLFWFLVIAPYFRKKL